MNYRLRTATAHYLNNQIFYRWDCPYEILSKITEKDNYTYSQSWYGEKHIGREETSTSEKKKITLLSLQKDALL